MGFVRVSKHITLSEITLKDVATFVKYLIENYTQKQINR